MHELLLLLYTLFEDSDLNTYPLAYALHDFLMLWGLED